MAARVIVSVLVLLCCVSESWQRCFSDHCDHHSPLTGCLGGTYQCAADEFCETTTHLNHGNAPWVLMNCRPQSEMANCWAEQASNDAACDPNKHDLICHWCCTDEQCMRDLATGVFPTMAASTMAASTMAASTMAPGASTMAASTMAPGASTMAASTMAPGASTMAASTMAPGASTMAPTDAGTTPPSAPCEDLYLGDCSADYAGRCSEPLIHQLCQKTCGLCT
ncbi:hypothetical protein V1264_006501 [Littorina saxatilis]|uniref:ShKT domain-containing protein n=2 Tax=Littorina saxatilis TaxID=31220 RepID=A0AAN9AX67_9CAEN